MGATIRLYKIGAGKITFYVQKSQKAQFLTLIGRQKRENTRKKHAEYTLRKTKICKRKKEKFINGEIYGEKNQIIVANKSAMIRDKMRNKK